MKFTCGVIFNSSKPWFSYEWRKDEYGIEADLILFKFIFFFVIWR